MTQNWRRLPAPARPSSVAELAALDAAQVGLILGTTVRIVLEDTHPDGVDGDDVRAIVERCARARHAALLLADLLGDTPLATRPPTSRSRPA